MQKSGKIEKKVTDAHKGAVIYYSYVRLYN